MFYELFYIQKACPYLDKLSFCIRNCWGLKIVFSPSFFLPFFLFFQGYITQHHINFLCYFLYQSVPLILVRPLLSFILAACICSSEIYIAIIILCTDGHKPRSLLSYINTLYCTVAHCTSTIDFRATMSVLIFHRQLVHLVLQWLLYITPPSLYSQASWLML